MKKIIFGFLLIFLFSCQKNDKYKDIKIEFKKQDYMGNSLKYKISLMKMNRHIYESSEPTPMTKKYKINDNNHIIIDLGKRLSWEEDFRKMKYNPDTPQWFYEFTSVDSTENPCFLSIIDYNYAYYRQSYPYSRYYNEDNNVINLIKKHCNSDTLCYYEHYPMILLNKNCDLDSLYVGYHFLCVQEALDKDGVWKPINRLRDSSEGFIYSLKFERKEFIIALLPKYEGNFETKLRVRWRNGKKVYITKPFIGKINRDFLLEKKDILYHKKDGDRYGSGYVKGQINNIFLGNEFALKLADEIMKE